MCGAWFMGGTNNDDVTRQLVNILLTICSQWLGFTISLHVKILHSIINHLTTDFCENLLTTMIKYWMSQVHASQSIAL